MVLLVCKTRPHITSNKPSAEVRAPAQATQRSSSDSMGYTSSRSSAALAAVGLVGGSRGLSGACDAIVAAAGGNLGTRGRGVVLRGSDGEIYRARAGCFQYGSKSLNFLQALATSVATPWLMSGTWTAQRQKASKQRLEQEKNWDFLMVFHCWGHGAFMTKRILRHLPPSSAIHRHPSTIHHWPPTIGLSGRGGNGHSQRPQRVGRCP
ncbi:uncharacterized protein TRIVIDRAFT_207100 [Trichoderma virens Gv29-8]|uniref:Uncharacterized protein n=1 Tax=Hypocrea virens (strain Gv29-8 / FGSC 10586) TaxID=413071 RepID=G9NCD1_HYPVG|nr:uncharacterized protein TRIVIDRAFT_207100 [Trichoderma virens Gv29-8]EHK15355.1 hypothetical protein TRIVIDRAFT_207100 [Trichoderma virens Gv29-8]UKZ51300.1 hypothetical protein TrVGV298_005058 [Trichoderma virens]